jgi:hypothetical protein
MARLFFDFHISLARISALSDDRDAIPIAHDSRIAAALVAWFSRI